MEATLPGTRPRATYVSLGVAPVEATRTSDTQGHACMEAPSMSINVHQCPSQMQA